MSEFESHLTPEMINKKIIIKRVHQLISAALLYKKKYWQVFLTVFYYNINRELWYLVQPLLIRMYRYRHLPVFLPNLAECEPLLWAIAIFYGVDYLEILLEGIPPLLEEYLEDLEPGETPDEDAPKPAEPEVESTNGNDVIVDLLEGLMYLGATILVVIALTTRPY